MKLLVLQHIACEHPGQLREYLNRDGVDWQSVELDEGEKIPSLEPFDALWVMGGPMDVWDTDEHPWLIDEKAAIRRWVSELKRPYLGLCLGHQLLADAEPDTVSTWSEVPAYRQALINTLGEEALPAMLADATAQLPSFIDNSEKLYRNFMRAAF